MTPDQKLLAVYAALKNLRDGCFPGCSVYASLNLASYGSNCAHENIRRTESPSMSASISDDSMGVHSTILIAQNDAIEDLMTKLGKLFTADCRAKFAEQSAAIA